VKNPADDNTRPKIGFGWAFWIIGAIGLLFVAIYAVGGCLMHTIC
jgi:hypothetical protein